ncbi:MAG: 2-amino-4-hydroxy-6-hydroxymethyldihydropteridine diphosphokinase, partial [Pseudomonadota bacterium]
MINTYPLLKQRLFATGIYKDLTNYVFLSSTSMLHSYSKSKSSTYCRKVFIGIGSNLKPEIHIPWALTVLHQCFPALTQSKIYKNPAMGCSGPDFWNMVVQLPYSGSLDALSRTLKHLESQAEGDQLHKVGPRSRCLDLDILVFGNDYFQRASLSHKLSTSQKQSAIPRLEAFEFSYVLIPYLDLDP